MTTHHPIIVKRQSGSESTENICPLSGANNDADSSNEKSEKNEKGDQVLSKLQVNVVVIGAGASGLAAGRKLQEAGVSYVILEARERPGGRCLSNASSTDFPAEYGAEFIHGGEEEASVHSWVKEAGLKLLPVHRLANMLWRESGAPGGARHRSRLPAEMRALIEKLVSLYDDLGGREYAYLDEDPSKDMSMRDYLISRGVTSEKDLETADVLLSRPWNTTSRELSCADVRSDLRAHAGAEDHASSPLNGTPAASADEKQSDAPAPSMYPHPSTAREFRIEKGYSTLMQWMADRLNVKYGAKVSSIVRTTTASNGLRLTVKAAVSVKGSENAVVDLSIECAACIVTIPLSLLQQNVLKFEPALPARKVEAITAMRMNPCSKLLFIFKASGHALWDHSKITFMAHRSKLARWWTSSYGHSTTTPVMAAFLTDEFAARLDAMSLEAATTEGLRELGALLGQPPATLRRHLLEAKLVSWAKDDLARGGYSSCPPGSAWARRTLAEPIKFSGDAHASLFFAGEATAYHSNPQTVHGAIDTGVRAATECVEQLNLAVTAKVPAQETVRLNTVASNLSSFEALFQQACALSKPSTVDGVSTVDSCSSGVNTHLASTTQAIVGQ